ncbi:MAG: hypothetical protein C0501_19225 [Isosphaera sp.]|nr:hypothetical protein [Isosphaera sp.]
MVPFVLAVLTAVPPPVVLDDATKAKLRAVAFQAARDGDTKTLAAYFRAGQPVNAANARGDTLLILAVYHGHADAVDLVLKQPKVDLTHRNAMGFAALDGAAFKGSVPIATALVKAGADVNAKNESGKTALMLAALTDRADVVRYLLEAGADPTAADKDGNTALSVAEGQGAKGAAAVLRAARKP